MNRTHNPLVSVMPLWLRLPPPLINVDDLSRLPLTNLREDSSYPALAQQHPGVMLFPGDRGGSGGPIIEGFPGGGWRVLVQYRLNQGCRACERLAVAAFGFDFNARGR